MQDKQGATGPDQQLAHFTEDAGSRSHVGHCPNPSPPFAAPQADMGHVVNQYITAMTCSQCPDKLPHKRVRATAPPTCAGNCSTNVCRQLIRCATVFWQLLHQPFQAHGLLSYPVVGATALPIPPRNHLAVIACLANRFANLFGQLLSPSPIQPQPRSAAALISHSPTQA